MKAFRDVAPPAEGIPTKLKVFRDLHAIWNQRAGTKIMLNMQIAALHISFLIGPQFQRFVSTLIYALPFSLFLIRNFVGNSQHGHDSHVSSCLSYLHSLHS